MSELIGRTLGSYRIVEQLGMGGMATVYKAYQPNMDRNVAVKVLPRHFAQDPTFVGRFEQEAKVIARLEHARILPVYDYGESDGVTYIVMRYLDAGTLSERIRAGRIPLEETARIITQVSEGLDYAHRKGVIHRDIKPSNIMLDSNGDAYITDFGISKLIEGTAQFTGSGIVGTPDYVSPEQALGQAIDTRSDIYSLGIVLYQMVTNDVPFHAETPMAVIIKHIHEPLPMPRALVPDLPESVENVILKALAKNPEDRYQTCGELAQAFSAAVGGAQIPAPGPSVSRLPTALPVSTRPVSGFGDTGTMPISPPPAASQPTQAAPKKGSPLGPILIAVGVLAALGVVAILVLGFLNNARIRRENATATALVAALPPATTAPPTAAAPTEAASSPTGAPGSTDPAVKFEENFDGGALKPAWRWINKPDKANWDLTEGRLGIDVLPNTVVGDPTDTSQTLTAPELIVPLPNTSVASSYAVQVDVAITPSQDYEQAGIIVLDNNQRPWFNLIRGYCSHEPPSCSGDAIYLDDWRTYVTGPNSYNGKQAAGGKLPQDGVVTLRLSIDGRQVRGDFSVDGGKTWKTVGEWKALIPSQIGFVGLMASSDQGADSQIRAYFDNFVIRSPGS